MWLTSGVEGTNGACVATGACGGEASKFWPMHGCWALSDSVSGVCGQACGVTHAASTDGSLNTPKFLRSVEFMFSTMLMTNTQANVSGVPHSHNPTLTAPLTAPLAYTTQLHSQSHTHSPTHNTPPAALPHHPHYRIAPPSLTNPPSPSPPSDRPPAHSPTLTAPHSHSPTLTQPHTHSPTLTAPRPGCLTVVRGYGIIGISACSRLHM